MIQKKGSKPTVIHRWAANETGHLCGAPKEHWGEKYSTDEYALTLPLCEKCAEFPSIEKVEKKVINIPPVNKKLTPWEMLLERKGELMKGE